MKESNSTWLTGIKHHRDTNHLTKDISVDIAIIGGGITGITTAYLLRKTGKKVLLIDKGDLMDNATAYTTAFLTYEIDTDITDLVNIYGKMKAKQIWKSHEQAINEIEKIIADEKIDCEFLRCDEYITAKDEKEKNTLIEMVNAAKEIGYTLSYNSDNVPHFSPHGLLTIPNQAKFHPLKYCYGLLEKAQKQGVEIITNTEVEKLTKGSPNVLKTKRGIITADQVIITTYDPFNHPLSLFGKKGMYTSYVYELAIKKDSMAEGLYMDQANPYHYFRIDKGGKKDRMIVGGEDHRHEIPINHEKNYRALEDYICTIIPKGEFEIVKKWNGPILEPSDGLAYIGKLYEEDNVLVAMGFSGNGMTYSMIAAQLFYDITIGKKNAYEALYKPTRLPTFSEILQKGKDYTEELFGGAVKNALTK